MSNQQNIIMKDVGLNWCKLLGSPVPNYNKDGFEWTVDVVLTEEHLSLFKKAGVSKSYIKETDDGESYFKYVRKADERDDGSKPNRVPIVDAYGDPWNQETLIGNGSKADIKVLFNEMGRGPNKGKFKPVVLKIKINEHVPYEGGDDGFEYEDRGENAPSEEGSEW